MIDGSIDDTLPCRTHFNAKHIETAKKVLTELSLTSADLLEEAGLGGVDWQPLLRATIESMRGSVAAKTVAKQRFVSTILTYCQAKGAIKSWESIGTRNRADYSVYLPDDTRVGIEAKGCPDGNNTNIWDRPSWADEFVVWSLCPESLQHNPGKGVWSGIATRLLPNIAAEKSIVDAYIVWDGRCGTSMRPCPKHYGVGGEGLRARATDYEGKTGKDDWVPPPCIYLLPRSAPTVPANTKPTVHTLKTSKFSRALLAAFNVPDDKMDGYVHHAEVEAANKATGLNLKISAVSRCWPDEDERRHTSGWKPLKRKG